MSNFPPLPRYLTLEEAAQAMTDRTGKQWTPRQILGCAERHEITIFARISHAVKFVRVRPIEGRTNEIAADKGSLPILDTEAIRALLLAGEAHSTGWEEPATVDFFGEPVEAWQKVFELAPGEDAPLVRPDGCRVTAAGILQLVDTHTTPAQAEPQAAPVVAESANNGPLPLTTGDIAFCFDGIRWNEQQWRKPLGDKPKWLQSCVAIPGQRGVSETRWNPVLIAAALVHDGHAQARSIRAKFQTKPLLKDWLEAWKTYEADNFGTQ